MIVSPFGFFEVQMKGVFRKAFELRQVHFYQSPKSFDTVDVDAATREFIL